MVPRQAQKISVILENSTYSEQRNQLQFSQNMRFNHNQITYEFIGNCPTDRIEKMLEAFNLIQEQTEIISFSQSTSPDITISCSKKSIQKEENIFVAGEGGPSEFINSTIYPVILKGKILLYEKETCAYPIVELHELLHVFGFDHSQNKDSIMYPISDCKQRIDQKFVDHLIYLYSIKPLPELKFESVDLIRKGNYLNFNISVSNIGILDADNVSLIVNGDSKEIKKFNFNTVSFAQTQSLSVENLRLPILTPDKIEIFIDYSGEEYNKENNLVSAAI